MHIHYNESEWQNVQLDLQPSGKAPKKYGEGVFRFSAALTLSVIMPKRGWQLLKKTKNYVYLKPPATQPFVININIPTKEQAIDIADQFYKAGQSWMGQLGEWPAWYFHERSLNMYEIISNDGGEGYTKRLLDGGPSVSSLYIGEYGVWLIELKTTNGVFTYHETDVVLVQKKKQKATVVLVEGEASDIVLNKYERSKVARDQCVLYHGTKCMVCGIDFKSMYGDIGQGFIHIHHIIPISKQRGAYEVDPINDLVPLCPNCHAMAHRRTPPVSIEELRTIIRGAYGKLD
jgi:5-methylcytosine-specific restriction protein A